MPQIHHHDRNNVGDWWSRPGLYFPLRPGKVGSITTFTPDPASTAVHLLGGGGLGSEFFRKHIERLAAPGRRYPLVAWGVGVDTGMTAKNRTLDPMAGHDLYGDYFDAFDDVGTRVWSTTPKFRWVPCVSAMHPLFFALRDRKPTHPVGVYSHQHVPLKLSGKRETPHADNSGSDIRAKLQFLADHEVIVTNTYHGVYWATLLGRKVVCTPFKSGLFSFRHPPVYCERKTIGPDVFRRARSYPGALEECRLANIEYYRYLTDKYGDF